MKLWITALLPLALCAQPSTKLIVARETPVELRLIETLSSADAEVHDRVEFEVAEDVRIQDRVVIPKGSFAWGVVTASARKSRMRRNGKLDIDMQALCMPDGQAVPLHAMRRGTQNVGATEVAASDSLFALPALPVMLFVWGKDVTIEAGREFTTFLAEDVVIPVSNTPPKPSKVCPATPAAPVPMLAAAKVPDDLSMLTIRSNPPNAEIYVDDRFMGNTPAVLRLPPGEHQIRLILGGSSRWERMLAVTPGGESNIQATLESTVMVQKQ